MLVSSGCIPLSTSRTAWKDILLGCYDVNIQDWTDPDGIIEAEEEREFASWLELTELEVEHPFYQRQKIARLHTVDDSTPREALWRIMGSRLSIWVPGLVGYAAYLEQSRDGLKGELKFQLDSDGTEPKGTIILRKRPCV